MVVLGSQPTLALEGGLGDDFGMAKKGARKRPLEWLTQVIHELMQAVQGQGNRYG